MFFANKRIKKMITALVVGASFSYAYCCDNEKSKKHILMTQIVDHPAVNAVREGIKKELNSSGLDYELIYQNAQGNPNTARQIGTNFASRPEVDIVIAITTLSAQTIKAAFKGRDVPIVFAAVTDPKEAQLVENLDKPGGYMTGTTDRPPIKDQVKLIRDIMIKAKEEGIRLGVIYNAGEVNSVKQIELLKDAAKKYNIQIVERTADNATKVFEATSSLVGKVDAIYIPLDNVAASATTSIIQVAMKAKIPAFASDPEGVSQGAVATIGSTHYDEGLAVGRIVLDILNGQRPGDIPVRPADNKRIYFNGKNAAMLGLRLPDELLETGISVKYVN